MTVRWVTKGHRPGVRSQFAVMQLRCNEFAVVRFAASAA